MNTTTKTVTIRITDEYGTVWGRGEGNTIDEALEAATTNYNNNWRDLPYAEHEDETAAELEASIDDLESDQHYATVIVDRGEGQGPRETVYTSIGQARDWEA